MNERKAKLLRKRIYGDLATNSKARRYVTDRHGTTLAQDPRGAYQRAKRGTEIRPISE
jgi:Trp operon repressor